MEKEMRILLTGATGLVGQLLAQKCVDQGIPVHFLTTSKGKRDALPNCQGFYWQPDKGEMDLASLAGVTHIINLAGAPIAKRWTDSYKELIRTSRTTSLKTLYKGIQQQGHRPQMLVSASAIGIYPDSASSVYKEETTNLDRGFLGQVVQDWEAAADAFSELGLGVAKLRVGLVLSTRGGALPPMALPTRWGLGTVFGKGDEWKSWIHETDIADMFLFLAKKQQEGVFNGVAPNPVTAGELLQELAKTFGKPLWLPAIPQGLMKIVLGDMAQLLYANQYVDASKIRQKGFAFQFSSLSDALSDLYAEKA